MKIEFQVIGIPKGAGSKNAFPLKKWIERICPECNHKWSVKDFFGKVAVQDASGEAGKAWRSEVTSVAFKTMADLGAAPLQDAVILRAEFIMPRPKHHYGTGKNSAILKDSAPRVHTSAPDATKLIRALEDSLKNICWRDDSQVVESHVFKRYGEQPGAKVTIVPYAEEMILREAMPKVEFSLT
jgi:Holliday junction resolvase RusA-like endonuclease